MDREFTLNRPKGKENIKLKSKIKNMVGMSIFQFIGTYVPESYLLCYLSLIFIAELPF